MYKLNMKFDRKFALFSVFTLCPLLLVAFSQSAFSRSKTSLSDDELLIEVCLSRTTKQAEKVRTLNIWGIAREEIIKARTNQSNSSENKSAPFDQYLNVLKEGNPVFHKDVASELFRTVSIYVDAQKNEDVISEELDFSLNAEELARAEPLYSGETFCSEDQQSLIQRIFLRPSSSQIKINPAIALTYKNTSIGEYEFFSIFVAEALSQVLQRAGSSATHLDITAIMDNLSIGDIQATYHTLKGALSNTTLYSDEATRLNAISSIDQLYFTMNEGDFTKLLDEGFKLYGRKESFQLNPQDLNHVIRLGNESLYIKVLHNTATHVLPETNLLQLLIYKGWGQGLEETLKHFPGLDIPEVAKELSLRSLDHPEKEASTLDLLLERGAIIRYYEYIYSRLNNSPSLQIYEKYLKDPRQIKAHADSIVQYATLACTASGQHEETGYTDNFTLELSSPETIDAFSVKRQAKITRSFKNWKMNLEFEYIFHPTLIQPEVKLRVYGNYDPMIGSGKKHTFDTTSQISGSLTAQPPYLLSQFVSAVPKGKNTYLTYWVVCGPSRESIKAYEDKFAQMVKNLEIAKKANSLFGRLKSGRLFKKQK